MMEKRIQRPLALRLYIDVHPNLGDQFVSTWTFFENGVSTKYGECTRRSPRLAFTAALRDAAGRIEGRKKRPKKLPRTNGREMLGGGVTTF